jgi:hypothetical protein
MVSRDVPSSVSPKTVLLRYLSSGTCQSRDELVLAVIGQGQRNAAHVRYGSLADIRERIRDVRFILKADMLSVGINVC